mgnify:CR=1 FL=1
MIHVKNVSLINKKNMKNFLITISLPFIVGLLGAYTSEYILQIGVLGGDNLKYFILVGAVAAAIIFYFSRKISYSISTIIGFILIPYFAFLIGQIDFYMVDDNLAEGITVIEVRPTMDKIGFGTPDKGEVAVWQGPNTLKLHPGENRVKLGRFDMPKGTYQGGNVYIGDIQVDIEADMSILKNPTDGQAVPADKYAEVFEMIKGRMVGNFGPFNITLKNSSLNGNIGKFTISAGSMTQPLPIPKIDYPGMGGPDITLDITLDEMGKPDPSKIKAIVDMPPGVGQAFPSVPGVEFK